MPVRATLPPRHGRQVDDEGAGEGGVDGVVDVDEELDPSEPDEESLVEELDELSPAADELSDVLAVEGVRDADPRLSVL